ncbi:MAG: hypothetical protein WC856_09415 [Methylococcaceae bacterium]|jgi:hypothetical protein
MSDLHTIARAKVDAAVRKSIDALTCEVAVMKNEHAARGMLRSDATLKSIRSICSAAMKAHGETIATEYRWALNHALLASQTWADRLISEIPTLLEPLYESSVEHIKKETALVGKPELAARLISDLDRERQTVTDDATLSIRAAFSEKKRGLVRALPATILKFLTKPFTGGG